MHNSLQRYEINISLLKKKKKIRRDPKLEGCVFANFENSSGTEGQSAKVKERKNKTENNFQ